MTTPEVTPEVVEAVAKAIHNHPISWMTTTWDRADEHVREAWRVRARAAIAEYVKQTGAGK